MGRPRANYPYEVPTTWWPSVWRAKMLVFQRFFKGFGGGENPDWLNLSLGWPSVWRAKVMVFHRSSIGVGGGEIPDSLNLSLGWPSVWRAKVMVFHRFSIGVGGSENSKSLNLSLGWPSIWRAKVMVVYRCWWLRKFRIAELKLRLALSMDESIPSSWSATTRWLARDGR